MQDLNQDIDDLFRGAVNDYPLKPCDSRWNDLSGKITSLNHPTFPTHSFTPSKNKKAAFLFSLLLLLPIALVFMLTSTNTHPKVNTNFRVVEIQKSKSTEESNTNPNSIPAPSKYLLTRIIVKQPNKEVTYRTKTSLTKTEIHNRVQANPEKIIDSLKSIEIERSALILPAKKNIPIEFKWEYRSTGTLINPANFTYLLEKNDPLALTKNMSNKPYFRLQHLNDPIREGFYLGAGYGPLWSQVKNHKLKNSGYDFGLLMGYTLTKKLSIESGLMYARQYFSVSGPSYNVFDGIYDVTSLEASRTSFQIPLKLKYNIANTSTSNFFLSAGISSYFEVNDKVFVKVASGDIQVGPTIDYSLSSLLPAYLDLSLGYEFKIGNFSVLRIEPYSEIPINGSTGNSFKTPASGSSLQVFNAGIHLIIYRFMR